MLDFCLLSLLIPIAISIFGLCMGKSIFVKILFLNSLTTVTSLFIVIMGMSYGKGSYIDIALIYFILGFIGSIAYLEYFLKNRE